jgi:hypothetical protein
MSDPQTPWTVGIKTDAGTFHPDTIYNANQRRVATVLGVAMHTTREKIKASPHDVEGLAVADQIVTAVNCFDELLSFAQMYVDSQTMSADEYEQKYYPQAGPTCLLDVAKAAIKKARGL